MREREREREGGGGRREGRWEFTGAGEECLRPEVIICVEDIRCDFSSHLLQVRLHFGGKNWKDCPVVFGDPEDWKHHHGQKEDTILHCRRH